MSGFGFGFSGEPPYGGPQRQNSYSSYTVNRKKMKDDLLDHVGPEYGQWLESMLGEPLPAPGQANLFETLKTGVILCNLANAMKPGVVPKVRSGTTPFTAGENVQDFLKACKILGVKDASLFTVNDLLGEFNGIKVVQTLEALRKMTNANNIVPLSTLERKLAHAVIDKTAEIDDITKVLSRKKAEEGEEPTPHDHPAGFPSRHASQTKRPAIPFKMDPEPPKAAHAQQEAELVKNSAPTVEEEHPAAKLKEEQEAAAAAAAAAAKLKHEQEAAAAAAAAAKKAEEEAAAKLKEEQAAAAAAKKAEEEAKAQQKQEEEALLAKKQMEDEARRRKEAEKEQREKAEREAEAMRLQQEAEELRKKEEEEARLEQEKREKKERKEKKKREQEEKERLEREELERQEREELERQEREERERKKKEEATAAATAALAADDSDDRLSVDSGRSNSSRTSLNDAWGIYAEVSKRFDNFDPSAYSDSSSNPGSGVPSPRHPPAPIDTQNLEEKATEEISSTGYPPIPPRGANSVTLDILEAQNEPDFEDKEAIPAGTKVRALYPFEKRSGDEISFKEDDKITIVNARPGNPWWFGEHNGHNGWFPAAYTEVLTSTSKRTWVKKLQPDATAQAMSAAEKLQALMDLNQKSATLPSRFRKPATGAPAPAGPTSAPTTPVVSTQSVPAAPVSPSSPMAESPVQRRPNPKAASLNRKSLVSSIVTTSPLAEQERWKDKVTPEVFESVSEKERQRQEVIYELIRTEREYVRDLDIIIDVFLQPIKQKKILTGKEMTIFSSVDQLKPVHEELLTQLSTRFDRNPVVEEVGDVFVTMSAYFKIYKVYCRNHPYSMMEYQRLKADHKNKKFRQFEEECFKKPECRMMDLQSFLLKPVQRICKYPLLIREILKYTDEDHKDREQLERAYSTIQVIVQIVNEATKEMANMRRIVDIQKTVEKVDLLLAGRKLLFEDIVTVLEHDSKKDKDHSRFLYLFNDMLLVTRQKDKDKPCDVVLHLAIDEVAQQSVNSEEHIVHFAQRPKSMILLGKEAPQKFSASFKDEESKKKFLEAWEQAVNWKEEAAKYSIDSLRAESLDGYRTDSGDSGSIRDVDAPPETNIPSKPGLVTGVKVFELVLLPNTQSHGSYKSSRHLLLGVHVSREGDTDHEIYKSFEEIVMFNNELKKTLPDSLPKLPHFSNGLMKADMALQKVDEVNTYFNEIVKVAKDAESKAVVSEYFKTNSVVTLNRQGSQSSHVSSKGASNFED